MRRIIFVGFSAALALGLSGCVNRQQIAAGDDFDCQSYGATPGTDAYFNCRMIKEQQRQATNLAVAGMLMKR